MRICTLAVFALSLIVACGSASERNEKNEELAEQIERAREEARRARERGRTEPAKVEGRPNRSEKPKREALPREVKLLNEGAAPRSPLRYRLSKGTTTTLQVAHRLSGATSSDDDGDKALDRMSIEFAVTVSVGERVDDGVYALTVEASEVRFGNADLSPGMVGLMNEEAQSSRHKVAGRVNERGILSGLAPDGWRGLPIDLLWVALPKAPIGKGGRWRVTHRTPSDFGDVIETVEYTIQSRTDTDVVLTAEFSERLADHKTSAPDGARQVLNASHWKGIGAGRITLSLEQLAPTKVESTTRTTVVFRIGSSETVTSSTMSFTATQE